MKRIRCPKCDEPILFDDKLYAPGRTLVFECTGCSKQFKIRIPSPQDAPAEEAPETHGTLIVIENPFHLKQLIPLVEGENVVGRHVRGTKANAAIKTVDPSVDTTHCIISVKLDRNRQPKFVLRDAPSNTGTFLHNEILRDCDRIILSDSDIITIGATTMIFRIGEVKDETVE